MYAQFASGVEQHNVGAAPDQPALAQIGTDQGSEQVVLFVDPGDLFGIGGRTVRGFLALSTMTQP